MKKAHLLFLAVLATSMSAFTIINSDIATIEDGYKVGDLATDFSLKNIDDKMVSLSDFKEAKGYLYL
jgi:hypothetical protein